jgi:4-hydroxy-tetrahydrodipicolinate synthase
VEALLKAGVAAERIGIGGGFPAVSDAVALTRGVLSLGINHVLYLPPYFDRSVTPDGIEDAFAAIIDGVADDRLRAYLYHIPQVSGVAIPPPVAARLRKRYGKIVAGLKDSSGDFRQFQVFRAAAPELAITVGNEADIARAVAAGGAGTICGMANVVPDLVKSMLRGADVETRMQAAIDVVIKTPSFLPTLKAILAAQTGEAGWLRVRPPLRPLTDGTAFKLKLDELTSPAVA